MLQRVAFALSLAAVFAFAGAAFAGNGVGPNKQSSSTISPPVVVSSATLSANASATSGPRYGDTITFTVSTTQTGNPFVNLNCYQNGVSVYEAWAAFWPDNENFVLSSPIWKSGAADCTANVDMYVNSTKYKVLASTSFHVDP
jgi:hypothetical protein